MHKPFTNATSNSHPQRAHAHTNAGPNTHAHPYAGPNTHAHPYAVANCHAYPTTDVNGNSNPYTTSYAHSPTPARPGVT